MATTVTFKRPDGETIHGYLAEPEHAAGAAAVVVIQEWWGVNEQIRGVADRLASAGYVALVPDLYRGKSTVEAEEAHHLMTGLNFGDAASQDVRGAVQFLKTRSGKVGVTGFCMGGALTLLALCTSPEIDAGVVWYGCPPLEYIDATKIKAQLQGHWATQDEFFPIASIDSVGGQTTRSRRDLRLPSLPRTPCLCQRDRRRAGTHPANPVRPGLVATSVGSHFQLLRPVAQMTSIA